MYRDKIDAGRKTTDADEDSQICHFPLRRHFGNGKNYIKDVNNLVRNTNRKSDNTHPLSFNRQYLFSDDCLEENRKVSAQSCLVLYCLLHCVSKNGTSVTHYRFNPHQPISVIFGRDVAETVCY